MYKNRLTHLDHAHAHVTGITDHTHVAFRPEEAAVVSDNGERPVARFTLDVNIAAWKIHVQSTRTYLSALIERTYLSHRGKSSLRAAAVVVGPTIV